jgi:hypothetical protein
MRHTVACCATQALETVLLLLMMMVNPHPLLSYAA